MEPSVKSLAEYDQLQAYLTDWYRDPKLRWAVYAKAQSIIGPYTEAVRADRAINLERFMDCENDDDTMAAMAMLALYGLSVLYHEFDGLDKADP